MKEETYVIRMTRFETMMNEVVIPSLKRIEKRLASMDRKIDDKIGDLEDKINKETKANENRIVALELWRRDMRTMTRTGLTISKKAWAIIAGVVSLIYALAKDWIRIGNVK